MKLDDTQIRQLDENVKKAKPPEPPPVQPSVLERPDGSKPAVCPPHKPEPPPQLAEQLAFPGMAWSGEVPPQKWMNFYTKVLSKFAAGQGLKLKLNVEVKPDGGISRQRLEETKAALHELGLNEKIELFQTEGGNTGLPTIRKDKHELL